MPVQIGCVDKSSGWHRFDVAGSSLSLSFQSVKNGLQTADTISMSINPLSSASNSYIQSLMANALGGSSSSSSTSKGVNSSSLLNLQDNNSLSPFAQMLSTLQQLQQSNPTQYQQVTKQISSALQSAAQTAQSDGNTAAANQLNQLATDFSSASKSGQLPNVQDLAQAVQGGHHHHGHGGHHHDSDASSSSSSTSSDSSTQTANGSQAISQFGSLQTSSTQAFNPTQIILNTLSNAGLVPNS